LQRYSQEKTAKSQLKWPDASGQKTIWLMQLTMLKKWPGYYSLITLTMLKCKNEINL